METKQRVTLGVVVAVGIILGGALVWEGVRTSAKSNTPAPTPPAPGVVTAPDGSAAQPVGLPVSPQTGDASAAQPGGATPPPGPQVPTTTTVENDRIRFGSTLPFPVPSQPGLEVEGGALVSGQAKFSRSEQSGGTISRLFESDGEVWVMVEVDPANKKSLLGRSVALAERVVPPYLIVEGAEGQVGALGIVYEDAQQRMVVLEPQLGMRGISVVPELMTGRTDQKLWLLFRAPKGGVIRSLWFGRKKKAEWEPGVRIPG